MFSKYVTALRGPYVLFTFLALSASGCGSEPDQAAEAPIFLESPVLEDRPDSIEPLSVIVGFSANKPVRTHYQMQAGDATWEYTSPVYRAEHVQPLLYSEANKPHSITITIIDKTGRKTSLAEPLKFTSAQQVGGENSPSVSGIADMPTSGLILTSLFRYESNPVSSESSSYDIDPNYSLLLALNKNREIVWQYQTDYLVTGIEREKGKMNSLTLISHRGLETIDFLGRSVNFWQGERQQPLPASRVLNKSTTIETDNLHSGSVYLPNGNKLLLSTEMRLLDDYPASPVPTSAVTDGTLSLASSQPKTSGANLSQSATKVVGDLVLEVTPQGEIVNRWNLFELLDYHRSTYNSSVSTYGYIYPSLLESGQAKSWTQADTVAYNTDSDTIIVSLKHQDAVIGIDRSAGNLKWILGDPTGWVKPWADLVLTPHNVNKMDATSLTWPYYPSSLSLLVGGDIALLDSARYRAVPPNAPSSSAGIKPRILVLRVDEQAMTFEYQESYSVDTVLSDDRDEYAIAQISIRQLFDDESHLLMVNSFAGTISLLSVSDNNGETMAAFTAGVGSAYQWGISDVLAVPELLPPSEYQHAANIVALVSAPDIAGDPSGVVVKVTQADTSASTGNLDGHWQMRLDESATQSLTLAQSDQLLTGKLDDYPIVGWVKGNTFSMTVRRGIGKDQIRFRYRAVINEAGNEMLGHVFIEHNGTVVSNTDWSASRE